MAKTQAKKTEPKEVKAFARFVHTSPQKLRLVADLIRNKDVESALEQMRFSSKNAALPLSKALLSAVANAVHNFDMKREDLYVKAVSIDGGPVYKKLAFRARGQGFLERKRTSHINVVLGERKNKMNKNRRSIFNRFSAKSKDPVSKQKDADVEEGKVSTDKDKPKHAPKSDEIMKNQKVSLKRRLFNRKSG